MRGIPTGHSGAEVRDEESDAHRRLALDLGFGGDITKMLLNEVLAPIARGRGSKRAKKEKEKREKEEAGKQEKKNKE